MNNSIAKKPSIRGKAFHSSYFKSKTPRHDWWSSLFFLEECPKADPVSHPEYYLQRGENLCPEYYMVVLISIFLEINNPKGNSMSIMAKKRMLHVHNGGSHIPEDYHMMLVVIQSHSFWTATAPSGASIMPSSPLSRSWTE